MKRRSGLTILEVLMAIFVILIGIVGVLALFPIGVRLSQAAADDVLGAMTAQNALAAMRVQTGLANRAKACTIDGLNPTGDALCWKGLAPQESKGIEALAGTIASDPAAATCTRVQISNFSGTQDGRSLQVKASGSYSAANRTNCGLLLMTSGNAQWKLYRLDDPSGVYNLSTSQLSSANYGTDFVGDGVKAGDSFRLLGAAADNGVWATVPDLFYSDSGGVPKTSFVLGTGAAKGYGYLAVICRLKGYPDTFRVDILVYKGFDKTLPPEGNMPAVGCYTTILSAGMLQ